MIFVTVGTHEQPFDRLVKAIDELKRDQLITDDIFIQTGYSTYSPKYCEWSKFVPYADMEKKMAEARIVITHGGPASFIMPLQMGKTPVVVPRQAEYGEHVNNHQLEFVENVSKRMGTIIPVYDIADLRNAVCNYDTIISTMTQGAKSHNEEFNREFEKIADNLFQ